VLVAVSPLPKLDIDGEAAGDRSGSSISMPDANTLAIGAPYNDGNGSDAGHVRICAWNEYYIHLLILNLGIGFTPVNLKY
jgi:hypothetical protein